MLAKPISAQDEAAGAERCALVQALDRLRIVGGFGQDCEREVAHGARGIASSGGAVHRPRPRQNFELVSCC